MSYALQSPKSGTSASTAIGNTNKRRKGLLADKSWIKSGVEDDDPVEDDPNYGRDVLGNLKPSSTTSKRTTTKTVVTDSTASSQSTPTPPPPPPATAPKPPIPAKKPTTPSTSFTARVFAGANSTETVVSPVKKTVEEKYPPVPKEPPKEVPNRQSTVSTTSPEKTISVSSSEPRSGSDSTTTTYSSTSITSSRQSIVTITSSEKISSESSFKSNEPRQTTVSITSPEKISSESSFKSNEPRQTTVSMTSPEKTSYESSYKSFEPSYSNSSSRYTTNTTTTKSITSSSDIPPSYSSGMDGLSDYLISSKSPSVQTNFTRTESDSSSFKYPSTSFTSSRLTVDSTYSKTPSSPLSPVYVAPVQSPTPRIVGKRDLCSFCSKGIVEGERIILEDLNIFSHTFCFKCESCNRSLGNLAAGDPLWVHKGRVICVSCFSRTKDQWYR